MAARDDQGLVSAAPSLRRIVRRFWPQVRTQRVLISGSMAALLGEILLRVAEPWPLKFVFDRIIPTGGEEATTATAGSAETLLLLSAGALVVVIGLRAWVAYLATVGFAIAGNRIVTSVRGELFAHLQRLSLSFHHKARTGDLLTRVLGDIGRLQEVVVTAALPLAANVLTLVAMLVVMALMNWQLCLIALAIAPLFALATRVLGRRIRRVARRQREREGLMASTAAESIAAMRTVQSLSLEEVHEQEFVRQNLSSLKEGVQARRLSARLERVTDLLIAVDTALVLWFGGRLVLREALTPGDLIVFLAYLKTAFKPMRDLAKYTGRLAKAAASADRVLDVLDATPAIRNRHGATEAPRDIGSIAFDEVRFEYETGHPVLHGISFTARRGELVALVGPSGAGKSTIISLLLRLYEPTAGRVLIDGHDLREHTWESVRARIAVVPQENVLFGVSVRDNIAYGLPGASHEQVESAARLAHAHEFVTALPDGYDTMLSERGDTLSGGQRQRIAIARSAIRGAPIMVLDEPTANLDRVNADAVRAALDDLRAERVMFVITHDAKLIERADRVVAIDGGRLVEPGPRAGAPAGRDEDDREVLDALAG